MPCVNSSSTGTLTPISRWKASPIAESRGRKDFKLIITAADTIARQTQFFKTHSTTDIAAEDNDYSRKRKQVRAKNGLVKVVVASSVIPTYWDPIPLQVPDHEGNMHVRYMVDGGVGSFGNPAAVVAWEFSGRYTADPP